MRALVGILFQILLLQSPSAFSQYKTSRQSLCDGFPAVAVGTAEGTCLGLVADRTLKDERTQETFIFPRKILELTPKRFLIVDMGGWQPPNRGALWELDLQSQPTKLWKLVKGLRIPHGMGWGPDGHLYIGESHRLLRFSKEALLKRQPLNPEVVIENLKFDNRKNMHPLINFTFGYGPQDQGDLYVNLGAPSDACVEDAPRKCAYEGAYAIVRRYRYQPGLNRYDPNFLVVAQGLRNSMGLVSHTSGTLLQAENSRDFSDANEPFDELNVINAGGHYGWPYCYNFNGTSPEWKETVTCSKSYIAPYILFPPHSAPLDLAYYQGSMFPQLRGNLIVSWHGYKPTGARLVAFVTDDLGRPKLEEKQTWSYSTGSTRKTATPEGGNLRASKYEELISSWDKKDGIRPQGSPVGVLVASDGSIYVVEDKNKTILRLSKSEGGRIPEPDPDESGIEAAKKVKIHRALKKLESSPALKESYQWINKNILQATCVNCHDQLKGAETEAYAFMIGESWIEPGSNQSLLLQRLKGQNGLQKMPLGGALPDKTVNYIEEWIKRL